MPSKKPDPPKLQMMDDDNGLDMENNGTATSKRSTAPKHINRQGCCASHAKERHVVCELLVLIVCIQTKALKLLTAESCANSPPNSANEHTKRANRKIITPKDVLEALRDLEFEPLLPQLEAELAVYNRVQGGKRDQRKRAKDDKAVAAHENSSFLADQQANGADAHPEVEDPEDAPPAAKKARRSTLPSGESLPIRGEALPPSGDETVSEAEDTQGLEEEEAGGEEEVDEGAAEEAEEADGDSDVADSEPESGGGDSGASGSEDDREVLEEEKDEALDNGEDSD
ncbi:MAG: hypothetical protein M1829_005958 [Trizodia sp. TS-e1964]|nr:MAG: hypothetical protein M1829_005958 [Trizodia sp. TS-e1964]